MKILNTKTGIICLCLIFLFSFTNGGYPQEDEVEKLITLLKHEQEDIRMSAAKSLGEINDIRAKKVLDTHLRTGNLEIVSAAYAYFIIKGQKGTEGTLIKALDKYGDMYMAEAFLSCGNPKLEKAARNWAESNQYIIVGSQLQQNIGSPVLSISTYGGGDPGLRWGKKPEEQK